MTNRLFTIRQNEKGNVSLSLIAMKRHWTKHIYHSACTCKANRRQTRYIPLIYLHAFRIRKKEKGNISFFLIRYETALDRYQYACKAKRRQTRYTPLIYLHVFRIRKRAISPSSLFAMNCVG